MVTRVDDRVENRHESSRRQWLTADCEWEGVSLCLPTLACRSSSSSQATAAAAAATFLFLLLLSFH